MRQFREQYRYSDSLKNVAPGTCDVCGGEGRYRTTHKHRQPVIHKCVYCSGTGQVKIEVVRKSGKEFSDSIMYMLSESDTYYLVTDANKNLSQVPKEEFQIKG